MTKTKVRGELRRHGKLIFARYFGEGRAQEYVPKVTFKNGTVGENVLAEYDAGPSSDEWPRLIPQSLSCGPGIVAADSWLRDQHPTAPEMIAENVRSAGEVKEAERNGIACYWIHSVQPMPDDIVTTWDLYVNKATFEPVLESRVSVKDGKTLKSDTDEYHIEHLATDDGIEWRLDAEKLKLR